MHDLHTALYHLDDVERAARRDIRQARRHDRARSFGELAADLKSAITRSVSAFANPFASRSDTQS